MDNAHLKKTWEKGIKALEQRDFVRALASLKKVEKAAPQDPDVHFAMADAFLGQGKADLAIRQCQQGVDAEPNAIAGWIRLGRLFLMTGKGERALKAFGQAETISTSHPHAAAGIAESKAMLGDLEGAEAAFSQALFLAPGEPDLIISLARVQDARGQMQAAEKTLREACAAHPGVIPLWQSLGRALTAWDRIEEASDACNEAQGHHPNSIEIKIQRAQLAYESRDLETAQNLYSELAKTFPNDVEIQNDLAQVLASLGQEAKAQELLKNLTEREPLFGQPWLNVARAKRYKDPQDGEIQKMRAALKRRQLQPSQAAYLHFALGKALDDCQAYDDAFAHYQKANAICRDQLDFDSKALAAHVDRIIDVFTPKLMSQLKGQGSPSTTPLMIVGMPRSGTTLLEQVLCTHPDVETAGELRTLAQSARRVTEVGEKPWPECIAKIAPDLLDAQEQAYLDALTARTGTARKVIDKMPQNFLHLGFAALLFPKAVVVHCERDPLDTCLSNFFQVFPAGIDFAYDLADLGHYFRSYQRLMAHWQALLGPQLVTVSYEELVSEPEKVLRPLLEDLGLSWNDACLSHQETVGRVDTLSLYQVRNPLNTGSTERWRNYEQHLAPLRAALAGE
ncbi:MAG: hypothetical protein CL401_03220 [Acidiferrobacteraceae bacterium]|nr:hypothetical protein [Acidiferrobacteraceae bacterium]